MNFYEERISLSDVSLVEAEFKGLLEREIHAIADLEAWLVAESDLLQRVEDAMTVHYIQFYAHCDNEEYKAQFDHDQSVIVPLLKTYREKFNRHFYESEFRASLDPVKYERLIKSKVNAIELFREENLPLDVELDQLATKYAVLTGDLTVSWNGEEKTLPQMQQFLQSADRQIRKSAWRLVSARKLAIKDQIEGIMNRMIELRDQVAKNAGFENFRDYMFRVYERFDYTPKDCKTFHEAVRQHVVPLCQEILKRRQNELQVDVFRPWDIDGVPPTLVPLKPFSTSGELVDGAIRAFARTDEEFAAVLRHMRDHHLLDLDSRKAKAPGGFMSALYVTNEAFIFMNAAGNQDDVVTIMHEGGHAVHGHYCDAQPLLQYKSVPMESAEFASMGMELLSSDKWDEFYTNEEDLKRAQREHLEGIILFLPWAMVVDKFQHWMYENPQHNEEERNAKYREIADEFIHPGVDWTGLEPEMTNAWRMKEHIFSVPFYYIEYAIAQLGAVQIWKAYVENPAKAIAGYKQALSLGSSKSLPEVYAAAGIRFDFSAATICELMDFVRQRIARLLS